VSLRLNTVRVRLTVLAVLVVGLGLVAGSAVVVTLVRQNLTANAETQAWQRARDTAAALGAGDARPAPGQALIQVVDRAGQVTTASPQLSGRAPLLPRPPAVGTPVVLTNPGIVEDHDYLLVAVPFNGGAVYAASSLDPVAEAVDATTSALSVATPILLALIAALSWLLIGRALRPVEAIRREVAEITATELDRRVPEPLSDDEVGRLARTMNAMLARLQESQYRQARFVGDAAHELRSPVAGILTRLEVGLAHPPGADWTRLARDVHREARRLDVVTGELLALSKMDGEPRANGAHPVDLDEIVLDRVEAIRARGRVSVRLTPFSAARLPGRPDELRRVVDCLLDNAERHAVATVVVGLSTEDGHVELTVADDGAGIPADERERVFDRFYRLQAARDRDSGGAGLGLAIVREAVAAHGGRVWVADANGGAQVHVRLPAG
jgi:signal transduction histidine kinase